MATLRINGIRDNMSPGRLREILEEFGDVGDVSIHAGEGLVYGLAEMSREDAHEVIEAVDDAEWRAQWNFQGERGPGPKFTAEFANCSAGPWLSHEWVPSALRWRRKTEMEGSGFARGEPRRVTLRNVKVELPTRCQTAVSGTAVWRKWIKDTVMKWSGNSWGPTTRPGTLVRA